MVKVAVISVALTTVTPLTVIPELLTTTVEPATKLVPVKVTGTVVPWTPLAGLTKLKVGGGGTVMTMGADSVWLSIVALPDPVPALDPAVYVDLAEPASEAVLTELTVPSVPENVTGVPSGTANPVLPSLPVLIAAARTEEPPL
jgi:hypothetical protein